MKKLFSLALVFVMLFSCAAVSASADSDAYLGVMLSTNVMSLDTNLATDGESFEVIADCIDGTRSSTRAAIPTLWASRLSTTRLSRSPWRSPSPSSPA